MRTLVTAAAAAALCCASTARAQDIAEALCAAASKEQHDKIDPLRLRSVALKGVDADTLDYNHDGAVSSDEIFNALTIDAYDFCKVAAVGTPGRSKACGDDAQQALHDADANLASFWKARGSLYDVSDYRSPTAAEIAAEPGLKEREWAPLLDPSGRFGSAVCRRPGELASEPANGTNRFLLGADIDSLSVARPSGKDRLKKVEAAELSFAADNVADTRTFAISGVAGFKLLDSTRFKFTPSCNMFVPRCAMKRQVPTS